MAKFLREMIHFPNGTTRDNGWWEITGELLTNRYGGYHHYNPRPDDIIVEADGFENLDWFSFLIRPEEKTGWLAPDGTWYPCSFRAHAEVAEYVLKADTEYDLEKRGYIKIMRCSPFDPQLDFFALKHITKAQRDHLLTAGFSEDEIDYHDRPIIGKVE